MTTAAWVFLGCAWSVIVVAVGVTMNKILNNK